MRDLIMFLVIFGLVVVVGGYLSIGLAHTLSFVPALVILAVYMFFCRQILERIELLFDADR